MGLRSEIKDFEAIFERIKQGDSAALDDLPARFESLRQEAEILIRRQSELVTLYEIARDLASIIDTEELLQLMLTRALALVQAERGFIVLTDATEEGFHIAVERQYSPDEHDSGEAEISRSLIQNVLSRRRAVVTTNAQEDPRFQSASSIVSYRIRSVMAVPLIYEREELGAIYLDTRISSRQFTKEDLALLKAMANQAATAIHMARLYDDLETRNKQLQQALLELRATQNELIRSERLSAVGRFASGIIHDFKTPMTTIKGCAAFLGRDDLKTEDRQHFSKTVVNAVDILVGMAQEILDFVQGGGELQMEPITLDSFIAEITDFLNDDFAERGIEIRTVLNYSGTISLDRGKMRRVVVNIASNARDAMEGTGGIFTIASRLEDNYVRLDLSDDGPGIPQDILSTIFEPFVTQGKSHGTGLGLAISKKIVEDHGGLIEAINQPDQGASFVVRLPQP